MRLVPRAVAAVCIATTASCGDETVAPRSDVLMMFTVSVPGPGYGVFELDSMQFGVGFSGGPRLRPAEVTWSVSGGFATVSPNGVVTAIRATDFDLPSDPIHSQRTVTATVGARTVSQIIPVYGWEKPRAPAPDGVAYMRDERYFGSRFGFFAGGIDKVGEPFGATGELVVSCGTVVPGQWTVELSLDDLDFPLTDPTRKLLSTDTVSVVFEGEAPRLERWQPVGIRLRAPDGPDMIRRMRRATKVYIIAQSYSATDPSLKFAYRLGNLQQVAQATAFRPCN